MAKSFSLVLVALSIGSTYAHYYAPQQSGLLVSPYQVLQPVVDETCDPADPCFSAQVCKQPDPKTIFKAMAEASSGDVRAFWDACKVEQSGSSDPDVYVPDLCGPNGKAAHDRFFACMAKHGISKRRWLSNISKDVCSPVDPADPCFSAQVCKQADPKSIFTAMFEASSGDVRNFWSPCKVEQSGSADPDVYVPDLCGPNGQAAHDRFFACMAKHGISKGRWLSNIPKDACLPVDPANPCFSAQVCKRSDPTSIFKAMAEASSGDVRAFWDACKVEQSGSSDPDVYVPDLCGPNGQAAHDRFFACMAKHGISKSRWLSNIPQDACLPLADHPCLAPSICKQSNPKETFAKIYANMRPGPVRNLLLQCRTVAVGSADPDVAVDKYCSPDPVEARTAVDAFLKCYHDNGISIKQFLAAIPTPVCLDNFVHI